MSEYLLGQCNAYYQIADILALKLGLSLTNFSHLYSHGDAKKARPFLGLSPGPVIGDCVLEDLKIVAELLGKHLAYSAMLNNNILAAKITHQSTFLSHPDNSDTTNYFLRLVNQFVLDTLEDSENE